MILYSGLLFWAMHCIFYQSRGTTPVGDSFSLETLGGLVQQRWHAAVPPVESIFPIPKGGSHRRYGDRSTGATPICDLKDQVP